jgi:hypothetical protein
MLSSGISCHVALAITDISENLITIIKAERISNLGTVLAVASISIIRVERISNLGTTLTVISN